MAARFGKLLLLSFVGAALVAAAPEAYAQTAGNNGNAGQGASAGTGNSGNAGAGSKGGRAQGGVFHYWIPGKHYRNCIGNSTGGCDAVAPKSAITTPSETGRRPAGVRRRPLAQPAVPTIAHVVTPKPRPLPPGSGPVAVTGDFVPGEVLATVRGGPQTVGSVAARFRLQARTQRRSRLLGARLVRFRIPDGRPVSLVLAQLASDARVITSAPNHIYHLQGEAAPTGFTFQRISLDVRHADGARVRVGVIDTAADLHHAALRGVVARTYNAWPGVATKQTDHATSVIGLIAGHGTFHGVAPGARVFLARAFENGQSRTDVLLNAMDWEVAQDVRIINMSFAGPQNRLLEVACRNARKRGILLVAAAGNEGPKAPFAYPAAYDDVVAVTATDARDRLMTQANRGSYVFLAAPGVDVMAPTAGGMDFVTGTSFAAAVVTGAAADLLHAAPNRSATSLERALAETAVDLGPKGRDADFGYGLIDVDAAARAAE